jgi:membrane protein DedA with SNARE-associated domain
MLLTSSNSAVLAVLAQHSALMQEIVHLGWFGLFLLSVVDASFVPLPLPGASDLFIALLAARQHAWLLLTLSATAGSVVGGASCYYVGTLGGVHMLEKRIPPRYFQRVKHWAESHAFLAVAVPAILPPPCPLIPFVLAAGALGMPKRKFYTAFTLSRALRHGIFAWLGLHYARHLVRFWRVFESRWAAPVLLVFWVIVIGAVAYGIWSLIRTTRAKRAGAESLPVY